jgi:hypothetical protein
MIQIVLKEKAEKILKSKHIFLEPYAPNTSRKFVFSQLTFLKELNDFYGDEVVVLIYVETNDEINHLLFEFKVNILDYSEPIGKSWWLSGLVFGDYDLGYRQGVIDVFNLWQQRKSFEWFADHTNPFSKSDYIFACFTYSGLSKEIIEKGVYKIDLSLVKEEQDLYYLVSENFLGERGYFGHNIHTFKDCLIEISHQERYGIQF